MRTAASTRTILTTVSGRLGARIPTGVAGDAAAIGGGLMAIVHRRLSPRSPTMTTAFINPAEVLASRRAVDDTAVAR